MNHNKATELDCQLDCKATEKLCASVQEDLTKEDKSLSELLEQQEGTMHVNTRESQIKDNKRCNR